MASRQPVRARLIGLLVFTMVASGLGTPPAARAATVPSTVLLLMPITAVHPDVGAVLRVYIDSTWLAASWHPTGTVKLWETTSGSPVLAATTNAYDASEVGAARAEFQVGLSAGTHTFVAEYMGDDYHDGASSTEQTLVVTKHTPTIGIMQSIGGDIEANNPFQIGAWVQNGGTSYVTGATFTFTRVGSSTPLCVVPVVGGGELTTCNVAGVPAGTQQFIASYSGTSSVEAAESDALELTINPDTVHATGVGLAYTTFFPYKDSYRDTVAIKGARQEPISVAIRIYSPGGSLVRSASIAQGSTAYTYAWNGRNSSGSILAEGKYKVVQTLKDAFGTTKSFTHYVTLSKKRATVYTKTITKVGDAPSAKGRTLAGSVTVNTSGNYTKISAPYDGVSWAGVGYELVLPSASIYEYYYLRIYGRRTTGGGEARIGAQRFTLSTCGYSSTADWKESCFSAWASIPVTSGTTNYYYRTANLGSEYRSARKVRLMVGTRGGTVYIYKAQLVVKYVILYY